MQIEIHQDLPFSIDQAFADFTESAEKLGRILGTPKMTHLADGTGEGGRCGVGSVRRFGPPVLGIEETILTCKRNELIEYTAKGALLKSHMGRIMFSSTPTGSHLHYVITLELKPAFLGPIAGGRLKDSLGKALAKYARGDRAAG